MRPNPLKDRLAAGETVFGTMVLDLSGPGLPTIFANAGADFIVYDMEAACFGIGEIKDQLAFCRGLDIVPLVNTASQDPVLMQLPLDCGAMGLMVPVVETGEQAERIARTTHYPPVGTRGVAFGIAHDDYSLGGIGEQIEAANQRTLVLAKIETERGVDNCAEILAVDGVDAAFIGHMDLSVSLGVPGEYENPVFERAVAKVIAACEAHGKHGACLVSSPEQAVRWIEKGFRIVIYSTDTLLLAGAYSSGLEQIRANAG